METVEVLLEPLLGRFARVDRAPQAAAQGPSLRFICVSYAQEFSLKLARDCREIMLSDWYRRAFPETVLTRAVEGELETSAGGGRFATSVGGVLTGRGGDVIIIDDPTKPGDAASALERAKAIEWFGATLQSRLDDKVNGSIVLVMQRLHEGDLSGHLLEGDGWDLLALPAIAELEEAIPIGEPLRPSPPADANKWGRAWSRQAEDGRHLPG